MKMAGWFYKLRKDAPTQDSAFDALLRRGYTTSRGKVCVASVDHAAAIMDNTYGPYDYETPAPLNPAAEPAVMAKAIIGYQYASDATENAAAIAAATAAGIVVPPTLTTLPNRFIEAPEEINSLDLALHQWILTRIGNSATRQFATTTRTGPVAAGENSFVCLPMTLPILCPQRLLLPSSTA